MPRPTRRRMLRITAAATACLGLGDAQLEPVRHRWQGSALGAQASVTLYHPDPSRARRLIEAATTEVDRLEAIFSLQRSDSAISCLNRDGRLSRPPLDLMSVLELAARISGMSAGAFDVTVQPLWRLLAEAAGQGVQPSPRAVEVAAKLIDWRSVDLSRAEVALGKAGMAITLNGIAQGYITDRVADMLRDAGVEHALIALGEQRALGRRPDGQAWNLGSELGATHLDDNAVAVSGPSPAAPNSYGTVPHLIDPHRGRPLPTPSLIAVSAPRAILADGLSTALAVADDDTRSRIAGEMPGLHASYSTSAA